MWTLDCPSTALHMPLSDPRRGLGVAAWGESPRPQRNTLLGEPMDAAVGTVAAVTTAWKPVSPPAARKPKDVP